MSTTIPAFAGTHWLFGSAAPFMAAPHLLPAQAGLQHGGLAWFRILHKRFLAVTDADFTRQALVTRHERYERSFHYRNGQAILGFGLLSTDGPFWLKRRRQILPGFRTDSLQRLVPVTRDATHAMLEHWEQQRRTGAAVPVLADTQHLTLTIIGQALLSTDVGRDNSERFGTAVRESLHLMRARNTSWFAAPLWLPTRKNRYLHGTRRILDDYVKGHIAERKGCPVQHDILQTMRQARDPETGAGIDDAALRDETKTLFLAGFETTATALAWALYALAQRPALAERMHEELQAVLRGGAPDFDSLKRLPLTSAVVNETLRLYPPVYNVARQAVADDEYSCHRIPRGTILLFSVYGMQRDPALWGADANDFRPERFLAADWPKQAFMPFAIGKHVCIGNHFAVTEMTVALAMIVQRYRLVLQDSHPVGMVGRITLAPDRDINLQLTPR